MSNEQSRDDYENRKPATPSAKSHPAQFADRTPIPIARLVMIDPRGITLPFGPTGENVQLTPILKSGINGTVRCDIDYRPWMRAFRVVFTNKIETEGKKPTFEPRGKPFFIPEALCVWVPVEEL